MDSSDMPTDVYWYLETNVIIIISRRQRESIIC